MPKSTTKHRPSQPAKLRRSTAGLIAEPTLGVAEHHETLVSLVDPFSENAGNAKIPDLGAGRTMSEQIRFAYAATSEASGALSFAIMPRFDNLLLLSAAGTYAAANSLSNSTSLVVTAAQKARITSLGVKVVSLLSATNSSGAIVFGLGAAPLLGGTVRIAADYYNEYDLRPVGDSSEWHLIAKPDSASALDWVDPGAYTSTSSGTYVPGWQTMYVIGQGFPASTLSLYIEIVLNVEFTFVASSALSKLATAQPVFNPQLLTARNEAQNNIEHVVEGGRSKLSAHIKSEAGKAIRKHVVPFVKKQALKGLTKLLV